MYLSDQSIKEAVIQKRIQVRPAFDEAHLRPVGLRVHLASNVLIPKLGQIVDLEQPEDIEYNEFDLRETPFNLEPGSFILASTIEKFRTDNNLLCSLDGRSTLARLGLTIHSTASHLDGTFGQWLCPVLEICNHGKFTVRLRFGTPIGMVAFSLLEKPCSRSLVGNQYPRQYTTTPPNLRTSASLETFDEMNCTGLQRRVG